MTRLDHERCLRCRSLMMGKTSPEEIVRAESALGPHICESDHKKVMVWISKCESGEICAGIRSPHAEQISRRTPSGWKTISGHLGLHVSEDEAAEAIGEICVRAHDARLMHCSVDDRNPWPDADCPWRLEIPLAVLECTT